MKLYVKCDIYTNILVSNFISFNNFILCKCS